MKLLIQPGDGLTPLLKAINGAKISVEIVVFRLDRTELERALANAVKRGVFVHALIAHMNRAGQAALRRLEQRLLAIGATVARTADDLTRYHGKVMIIDRNELYLLAFNFTYLDIEHSRSFGIVTTNPALVREAGRLFDADTKRQPYEANSPAFVVSPVNARKQLAAFLAGARKELLIYDPTVSDPAMIRLLEERSRSGVDVKILGRLMQRSPQIAARRMPHIRLHARAIVRDGTHVFIGSQSLRQLELDQRREIGVILRDRQISGRVAKTFHEDWALSEPSSKPAGSKEATPTEQVAKRVAKAVTKQLPPVGPVLDEIIREMGREQGEVGLSAHEVEATVKDAVKTAVKEVVKEALGDSAEVPEKVG
ncbi:MAG TPA: phospholipase D-like domain-containing protein [Bryobacteraceae bacterium]